MRTRFLLIIAVLALCLALPATAFAATGTITGTVVKIGTTTKLSGVKVTCGSLSGTTNSSGVYTITGVTTGATQTLNAAVTGYLTTYQITTITTSSATVNWALTPSYPTNTPPTQPNNYVVFAWNDLGMHCDQDSYKYMCVLPPYNTLHAEVFVKGSSSLKTGLTITYAFAKKTDSTLHTDFWTYASSFGWPLANNVGLTGNGLTGTMKVDPNQSSGYIADGIPITPYDDDGTWDPYGQATLTVKSGSTVMNTVNVVAPVSTEMKCGQTACHGTTNPFADILAKHDAAQGTTLTASANAGKPRLCADCHASNALGKPGVAGVDPLSYAMHNHHIGKVTNDTNGCYNCHPGQQTQCMRGIMARAGKGCVDCHGSIAQVASSQKAPTNRQAWLQEPKCGSCHDSKHQENSGKLYRFSFLTSSPMSSVTSKLYCEACHNGTHAEYTTSNTADAVLTNQIQGNNYWIFNCRICHGSQSGNMHR